MKKCIITNIFILMTFISLAGCAFSNTSPNNTIVLKDDLPPEQLWSKLQHTSVANLETLDTYATDSTQQGWIKLALLTKHPRLNQKALAQALLAWREDYPAHPANDLLPDPDTLTTLQMQSRSKQIALLLPQSGPHQAIAQKIKEGFLNAFYTHNKESGQKIKFYDTANIQDIVHLYHQAVEEGAEIIIGPLAKEQVNQLSEADSLTKPIIALNYRNHSSPTASDFYEFGLLPEDEVIQIANHANSRGLLRALIIAPQNDRSKRLVNAFTERWSQLGGSISSSWIYQDKTHFNEDIATLLQVDRKSDLALMRKQNNKETLEKQRRQDFDVIFLFSEAKDAQLIVPLLRYYYVSNIPIYATGNLRLAHSTELNQTDLQGIMVCDIPQTSITNKKFNAVGEDAYLLSQSLTQLTSLPNFPINGATGALSLSNAHQVHRLLPCTQLHHDTA